MATHYFGNFKKNRKTGRMEGADPASGFRRRMNDLDRLETYVAATSKSGKGVAKRLRPIERSRLRDFEGDTPVYVRGDDGKMKLNPAVTTDGAYDPGKRKKSNELRKLQRRTGFENPPRAQTHTIQVGDGTFKNVDGARDYARKLSARRREDAKFSRLDELAEGLGSRGSYESKRDAALKYKPGGATSIDAAWKEARGRYGFGSRGGSEGKGGDGNKAGEPSWKYTPMFAEDGEPVRPADGDPKATAAWRTAHRAWNANKEKELHAKVQWEYSSEGRLAMAQARARARDADRQTKALGQYDEALSNIATLEANGYTYDNHRGWVRPERPAPGPVPHYEEPNKKPSAEGKETHAVRVHPTDGGPLVLNEDLTPRGGVGTPGARPDDMSGDFEEEKPSGVKGRTLRGLKP